MKILFSLPVQENLEKQWTFWMKTAKNPVVDQRLWKNESRSRIMHTFFRRKSHPSPPTQYITMRTPISPSPRVGGHGGSHPHLVHEFIRSILEERKPAIDDIMGAYWTGTGICAHESAMKGGEVITIPRFE